MRRKPKFYQTKSFLSLRQKWERVLENEGLPDIESHKGRVVLDLAERTGFRTGVREANEDYYSWALSCLDRTFKTERHRAIWEAHARGKSAAAIGRELKPQLSRWRISDILREIEESLKVLEKRQAA